MAGTKRPPKVQPDGTFGWDQLQELVDPQRVRKQFEEYFKQALERMGAFFVTRARDIITDEKPFAPNALPTILKKGSDTPLIADGDLYASLTYDVRSWRKVRMGVNSELLDSGRILAEVLHEGATIRRKTKKGSVVIVIPPRPFLTTTFADDEFVRRSAEWMLEALDASLTLR
jgi:hypothetical protein